MFGFRCGCTLATLLIPAFFGLFAEGERFTAAHKSKSLKRSNTNFNPTHAEQVLIYTDESSATATLRLKPKLPLLILEDIDEHFNIACTDSTIAFDFHDSHVFEVTALAWSSNPAFAVVTNHDGCQNLGEHEARIVSYVEVNHHHSSIILTGERSSLRQISHQIMVDLGKHTSTSSDRHTRLPRAISTNVTTTSQSATTTFDFPNPTASATGASLSADVSFSRLNTTLFPPDSSIVEYLPYPIPENIRVSCRNCTMTGNIELIAGGFSINSSAVDAIVDFIEDGYLEFDATGISAYMDFELAFLPGFSVFEFTPLLPSIPLGAIEIAGVLKFGPRLDLTFPTGVTLNSPVTFGAGFAVSAPPLAKIYLNISSPGSSYTTGFADSVIRALPFTADAKDLSMNFSTGFRPQLVLGAGAGSSKYKVSIDGGVGVFLDLPTLSTIVDLVGNVNEKCEPTTTNALNGLVRVAPGVTYDGGSQWDLEVKVSGIDYERKQAVNWLSKTMSLPTQCLAWDIKASSLVDAASIHLSNPSSGTGGTSAGSAKSEAQAIDLCSRFLALASFVTTLWSSVLI